MSEDHSKPVLVFGASGAQGGAVARALLRKGVPVRGFTRSEETAARFKAAGMTAAIGSFYDDASLVAACSGAAVVFSMQNAPFVDPQSERQEARAIIAAALAAAVPQLIHTSVSGAGAFHRAMKDWGTGRWSENYWESKADVEDMVREAGFACWTILKPAFMMENFVPPKVPYFFPHLAQGELVTAFKPKTALVLVAADDVGAAATAAIAEPARFNKLEIELSGDILTMDKMAAVMSDITGRKITARFLGPEAAIAEGIPKPWVDTQLWMNEVPYPALPSDSAKLGLKPTSFVSWARKYFK